MTAPDSAEDCEETVKRQSMSISTICGYAFLPPVVVVVLLRMRSTIRAKLKSFACFAVFYLIKMMRATATLARRVNSHVRRNDLSIAELPELTCLAATR